MEQDITPVKLKLDEENSLMFEVKIEGEAPLSAPVYRLVCETGDIAYVFRGDPTEEGVQFTVPAMQNRLKEGSYSSHLEVVIENKLLIPLQLQVDFAPTLTVQVESVRVGPKVVSKPTKQTAAAKLLSVDRPATIVEAKAPPVPPTVKPKTVIQKPISEPKKHPTLREMYSKKGVK